MPMAKNLVELRDVYKIYGEGRESEVRALDGVSFFPAVVKVENGEGAMMNGMSVEYELVLAQSEDCLVVPAQAVQDTEQGSCLFVRTGRRPDNAIETPTLSEEIPEGFWAVPVEIGISDNSNVEIKSGVEEGTEVFTQVQSLQAWG